MKQAFLTLFCGFFAACGAKATDETQRDTDPDGGKPTEQNSVACPGSNESIDPTATIDDLEDANGSLLAVDSRSGGWWTGGDDTPGATIVPARSDLTSTEATPEAIPGGRCGSSFAMRVTGQGFLDWGALVGFSLAYDALGELPYDATGRQGVAFWAKIGDTSTNQVRVAFGDSNTEPEGGVCVEDGDIGETCYDTFGTYLTQLDTTWRHYRVPFTGLSQRNFGPPTDGVVLSELYNMTFSFDAGAIFDFWVDDLSFY